LITKVIKAKLGFNEPSVSVPITASLLYEEGEDVEPEDYEGLLPKVLADISVVDGTSLSIQDQSQDLSVTVFIRHVDSAELAEKGEKDETIAADMFIILGQAKAQELEEKKRKATEEAARLEAEGASSEGITTVGVIEDDDDIEIVVEVAKPEAIASSGTTKRPHEEDGLKEESSDATS
jgi:Ubiquitin/SUMO-activating enzyme ubiquitin-like domain